MAGVHVILRPLEGRDDFQACTTLQEEVWGVGFEERVPPAILGVARRLGGVVTGAFLEGELVGFVFGLTGIRDGRLVHWSDMLAVRPDRRGQGLGRALKEAQRDELLARGVGLMEWTFDPLEARNAHLNLNRLGAVAVEYLENAYGASVSPLHQGIGTDRLVVRWDLSRELPRVGAGDRKGAGAPRIPAGAVPLLEPAAGSDPDPHLQPDPGPHPDSHPEPHLEPHLEPHFEPGDPVAPPPTGPVTVAVPLHLQELKARAPERALRWREASRIALQAALAGGRVATAGEASQGEGVFRYLLEAPGEPSSSSGGLVQEQAGTRPDTDDPLPSSSLRASSP